MCGPVTSPESARSAPGPGSPAPTGVTCTVPRPARRCWNWPSAPSASRPRARPSRSQRRLRLRPAGRLALGPGHHQPGPLGHNHSPIPGSGHADHDPGGGHIRTPGSPRPARKRRKARPVPVAVGYAAGTGNQLPVAGLLKLFGSHGSGKEPIDLSCHDLPGAGPFARLLAFRQSGTGAGSSHGPEQASPERPLMILVGALHRCRSGGPGVITRPKRLASMATCGEDGATVCKRAAQGCLPQASVAKPSPTSRA